MKQLVTRFSVTIGVLVWIAPAVSEAASLYIDPAKSDLNRGDAVTMAVRLDVDEKEGECINAVDGIISYTENIEPVDISTGDSIFRVWVEEPTINRDDRTITFAGGIPNGYCGRVAGDPRLTNVLTEIVFRSPGFTIGGGSAAKTAEVTFADQTTAYRNDGRGTKAPLLTYGATLELSGSAGSELRNPWQEEVAADTIPPEEFSITLTRDERAFSGKHYIIFNTTDKQTGIDQYQVMEEPLSQLGSFQWGRADAPWVVARSPYVLKDQSLNSIIRVRALDKAGNEYIANLVPDESARTLSHSQVATITISAGVLLLLLIVGTISWWYVRRRKAKRAQPVQKPSDEDDTAPGEVSHDQYDE